MNGERNNYWLNAGVALAVGLVLSSIIFGWFYAKTKKGDEAITVTGAAKKRIKSDLVLWSSGVTYQAPTLADAYRQLSESVPRVNAPRSETDRITGLFLNTICARALDILGVRPQSDYNSWSLTPNRADH